MIHTGWQQYIRNVKNGTIPAGRKIKLAIDRFENFCQRDDVFFDDVAVNNCIDFFRVLKHFLGKSAGKPFILEPFQEFIIANIFGLKWKSTELRVFNEIYIEMARKGGKDAFIAGICLYTLIADGEAAPEIVAAANSANQAGILFNYIDQFSKDMDPNEDAIIHYRNYIKIPKNKGICTVISADPSKADGKNLSCFVIDEYHEAKDRRMYDVLKSSQGMRQQPLGIIITTAGFNLDGPCHDMYMFAVQILEGIVELDNFCPLIWEMDDEDDWQDKKNWLKCQPNLGVTVTEEFMEAEMNKALVDSTALAGVLTKTFNKWVQSKITWIPQPAIARVMKPLELDDFSGKTVIMGCDLSTVSDFSSISIMLPPDDTNDKYYFKTWTFLPEQTIVNHPNRLLYEKFVEEGSMIVTPGNVIDYDFILAKINEINQVCTISSIYLDKWNATSMQITLTEAGYDVEEFSQSVGNYNACTKEFEKLTLEGKLVIDKSANVLWQFGNVFLKSDINGNCKPSKESAAKKIDSVISITTALGGYLKQPFSNDIEIFVI